MQSSQQIHVVHLTGEHLLDALNVPGVRRVAAERLFACIAVDIKPKTKGFQVKQASAELVDTPKKEDVALFLHTSGTTSRPKVCACSLMIWLFTSGTSHTCKQIENTEQQIPSRV